MKYLTIMIVIFSSLAYGDHAVHDSNSYWQTVWDDLSDGDIYSSHPSGYYPAGEEGACDNVYASGVWVGLIHDSGYKVSVSDGTHAVHSSEYEPQTILYTTSNWPSGYPLYGTFDTYITCNDSSANEQGPIPISAARHTWSFSGSAMDDFVGFKYIIRNDSDETYNTVYITHVVDFDVGNSYYNDKVNRKAGRNLVYMYDNPTLGNGYFGVVCGTGDWTSVGFSYWKWGDYPATDLDKYNVQTRADWSSHANTIGNYSLAYTFKFNDFEPGETIVAGFYQVAGLTWGAFSNNVNMAIDSYVEDDAEIFGIRSASLGEIKAMFK